MKKNQPFLSIIIPVFNEVERINNIVIIEKLFRLNYRKFSSEIIVVNDGSTDKTLSILQKHQKRLNFKIISYSKNCGKGFAIKKGVLAAQGKFILFTDIDLSTPLSQFQKFIPFLDKFEIIIATRKSHGAKLINRQPLLRESLGKGFTLLSNTILQLNISDFTCGFKCFRNKTAKHIFSQTKINRWGFDCEILFIANKNGFRTKEIPVDWNNDSRSKVKFPADLINSLTDLIKIRLNNFRKVYN